MKTFDFTGTWRSNYFLSEIVAHITQGNGVISGRAIVRDTLFGGKDIYHFQGAAHGLDITAHHHSGRTFKGKMVGDNLIQGILTTQNGFRAKIKAKRISLTPEAE